MHIPILLLTFIYGRSPIIKYVLFIPVTLFYLHIDPPILTIFPSANRDVVMGETLSATCRATADPHASFLWFRGDQLLNNMNQSHITVSVLLTSDSMTTSSGLKVANFTSKDIGVYSCVAVNILGNDSRSFQVNTVGKLVTMHYCPMKNGS